MSFSGTSSKLHTLNSSLNFFSLAHKHCSFVHGNHVGELVLGKVNAINEGLECKCPYDKFSIFQLEPQGESPQRQFISLKEAIQLVLRGFELFLAKPTVTISPTKMDPALTGFYPVEIEVQWLKNGWPEKEGMAFGEELQNGDWTYQLQVMLETQPQQGDLYTCQVGQANLVAPITIQWEPRSSSSARSKLWMGIMGAMIGVTFLAMGLFSYLKSKKELLS
ncbi:DLA class II histocompatibility antigen, DR-1 beta chain-like [Pantherophis guttatus]|uniref:DLA class II histocompatibility antigen, DR-1 beta chain-like n=1 Tax=Pantherophis guttatus TaxID=94885 RepID=A0A6P9AVY3_PANGU|nr:DLA class II histocompatibility antigen, DR-1 beta chain-like [Pantherophis guttatus]